MARKQPKQRFELVHPHCAGIDIGSREHWVAVDRQHDQPVHAAHLQLHAAVARRHRLAYARTGGFRTGERDAVDTLVSGDRGGSIFERLAEAYAAPVRSLLVAGTQRIAVVQRRLALTHLGNPAVRLVEPPVPLPPLEQAVQWREHRGRDPLLAWLRAELRQSCGPTEADPAAGIKAPAGGP